MLIRPIRTILNWGIPRTAWHDREALSRCQRVVAFDRALRELILRKRQGLHAAARKKAKKYQIRYYAVGEFVGNRSITNKGAIAMRQPELRCARQLRCKATHG
jgi:hypothetical protein